MDHLHYRLNFGLDKQFITAWKSITKLVIFQSFVAKCCKMRVIKMRIIIKAIALRNLQFSVILYYKREIDAPTPDWAVNFLCVIQNDWKTANFAKAILSAFYNILQRNFGILLILWCSFKLWWNCCQNLVYNANGPLQLTKILSSHILPVISPSSRTISCPI
jgi:hypothetical protein